MKATVLVATIFAIILVIISLTGTIAPAYNEAQKGIANQQTLIQIVLRTTKAAMPSDLASILLAAAITGTALVATYRSGVFREGEQHLTLSQIVYTQQIGKKYLLVVITTTVTNSSKVLVAPTVATCRLSQTSPLTDDDVTEIYDDAIFEVAGTEYEQYGWWQLGTVTKHWKRGKHRIEPGETEQIEFQFIVSDEVRSITAYTEIPKPHRWYKKDRLSWSIRSFATVPTTKPRRRRHGNRNQGKYPT